MKHPLTTRWLWAVIACVLWLGAPVLASAAPVSF